MDKKTYIKKLSNGIKCLFIPTGNDGLIQIDVHIRTGMYHEDNDTLGLSHFLEHLNGYFLSKKYPHGRQM